MPNKHMKFHELATTNETNWIELPRHARGQAVVIDIDLDLKCPLRVLDVFLEAP